MLPAVLAYLGVDQGLRERFPDAVDRELASDGPYQFVAAFRNNELDYMELYPTMSGERAAGLLRSQLGAPPRGFLDADPRSIVRRVEAGPGPEHRWNVILVMVESLGAEYVGRLTPGSTLTPNLDRLADESEFFTRAYATGTRTVRGLEAVTLSIPPTPGRSIVKRIGRETGMWSLGDVLGSRGYDVRFLYGGRGYFDNMNAFFTGNGYRVVDQSSVPDAELRFTNAWGMSDQDLYRQALKAADAAAAAGTPFFFHLMTTSNHRPYTYPVGSPTSGPGRGGRAPSPTRMPRSRASSTPRARVPGSPTRSS